MDSADVDVFLTRLSEDYRLLEHQLEQERDKVTALQEELEALKLDQCTQDEPEEQDPEELIWSIHLATQDVNEAERDVRYAESMIQAGEAAGYVPQSMRDNYATAYQRLRQARGHLEELKAVQVLANRKRLRQ